MEQETAQQIDAVLLPFVRERDEAVSQQLLTHLVVDHAEPIIRNIVKHKLRVPAGFSSDSRSGEDAEDMRSEVLVQLLSRLSELREKPGEKGINNFPGYVAAITYSAWHEHLRRRHPQRHLLKNKLRYLLTHRASFAIWEGDNKQLLCGLAGWENQESAITATRRVKELAAGPEACERAGLSANDIQRWDLASLVAAVFRYLGSGVDLDDLVNLIAQWTGVNDHVPGDAGSNETEDSFERIPDPREPIDTELQRRTYLRRLWAEIRELKPNQRVALLLNLRDENGGDVVSVLPVAGIATMGEIADALSMPAERLATLWNELPLDDIKIATHLSITRQQVINLRKSARERLARRMKAF